MIALVDCNSFYASCEKVFRPDLEGKGVVVLSNNDGCIVAASKEAKEAGIKRAQPLFEQKKTIEQKEIRIFSSNYTLYADISKRIMGILNEMCLSVEVYSIDEAFITIPSRLKGKSLAEFAVSIRDRIKQCTGVGVSVGIGKTKTLSKIANKIAKINSPVPGHKALLGKEEISGENTGRGTAVPGYENIYRKTTSGPDGTAAEEAPEGVYIIDSTNIDQALSATAVEDIWMVGRQYAFLLHENSIHTALDLRDAASWWIRKKMTVTGYRTQCELKGEASFESEDMSAPRKGIAASKQFGKPVVEFRELREAISEYAAEAAEKLHRQDSSASAFTVFLETNRYRENERQYKAAWTVKTPLPVDYLPAITGAAVKALSAIYKEGYKYRKTGIIITDICSNKGKQRELFPSEKEDGEKSLGAAVREINRKYGRNTVSSLSMGTAHTKKRWLMRREMLSPCYTTRIKDFPVVYAK